MSVYTLLLKAGLVTLQVTIGAWILAWLLGVALAPLATMRTRAVRVPLRVYTTVTRAIPELVILYILYFGLASYGIYVDGVLAAIVALAIAETAFTTEYVRAGLLTAVPSQRQAGLSLGLSNVMVFRMIVFPQALPFLIPPMVNSFASLLKTATIASAVGVPEILYVGQGQMSRLGDFRGIAGVVILLYIAFTLPLTTIVSRYETRLRKKSW